MTDITKDALNWINAHLNGEYADDVIDAREVIKIMRTELIRLRKHFDDPGMEPPEYRTLLDLLMCSDPWPTKMYEFEISGVFTGERCLKDFADRKAQYMGYDNWIDAYHHYDPFKGQNESA